MLGDKKKNLTWISDLCFKKLDKVVKVKGYTGTESNRVKKGLRKIEVSHRCHKL